MAAWQATGEHPVVAVWTPEQLTEFLHSVRHDGLHALWWLLALRGLRRGEAAGLRWTDVDLDHAQLAAARQRTTAGYTIHEGAPKSATSRRIVALDPHTVQVMRLHHRRQQRQQERRDNAAKPCLPSGYVFTRPDGAPFHALYFTQRFRLLLDRAGLPPIRLHDLRHKQPAARTPQAPTSGRSKTYSDTPTSRSPRTSTPTCCPPPNAKKPRPPPG
jgi:integrase